MNTLAKLHWQCRRGSLELDLLIQYYIKQHDVLTNPVEQQRLFELLKLDDAELFVLLSAQNQSGV
jgi:antitoxin CptB